MAMDGSKTDKAVWGVEEVAAFLDVAPATVREQARKGGLPGRKVGKEWRFSRSAVIAWLEGVDPEHRLSSDDWAAIRAALDDYRHGRGQSLTEDEQPRGL